MHSRTWGAPAKVHVGACILVLTDCMLSGLLSHQVGTVRGEDYNFQFSGKIRDNKLHFRLQMEYEGDEDLEKVPSLSCRHQFASRLSLLCACQICVSQPVQHRPQPA